MGERALLSVRGLTVRSIAAPSRPIVDSISFDIGRERVGLVGESGSGKSLTARAVMGLLSRPLEALAERLEFEGADLQSFTQRQWDRLRGSKMALVLQDARYALNPVLSIGRQIEEMLLLHDRTVDRMRRVREVLSAVGLADPGVVRAYPHQLSGGMGQRAMLAMMLANGPTLLIADEPTSALDADLRTQVLELMCNGALTPSMGLLLISHDLQLVARYCDRAIVLYRGRIVDQGSAAHLSNSDHPYTRALWSCAPSGRTHGSRLPVFDRRRIDP
ncbi:MAG: ABC transporter ATP-binding protein [Steroidobacteraceae bacterium]